MLTCSQWSCLLAVSGWIAKDTDQHGQVERHIPPSSAATRQLTTDYSLGLGVDFTENPEKNPSSIGETNYNSAT